MTTPRRPNEPSAPSTPLTPIGLSSFHAAVPAANNAPLLLPTLNAAPSRFAPAPPAPSPPPFGAPPRLKLSLSRPLDPRALLSVQWHKPLGHGGFADVFEVDGMGIGLGPGLFAVKAVYNEDAGNERVVEVAVRELLGESQYISPVMRCKQFDLPVVHFPEDVRAALEKRVRMCRDQLDQAITEEEVALQEQKLRGWEERLQCTEKACQTSPVFPTSAFEGAVYCAAYHRYILLERADQTLQAWLDNMAAKHCCLSEPAAIHVALSVCRAVAFATSGAWRTAISRHQTLCMRYTAKKSAPYFASPTLAAHSRPRSRAFLTGRMTSAVIPIPLPRPSYFSPLPPTRTPPRRKSTGALQRRTIVSCKSAWDLAMAPGTMPLKATCGRLACFYISC